jgi:hypothetical protein
MTMNGARSATESTSTHLLFPLIHIAPYLSWSTNAMCFASYRLIRSSEDFYRGLVLGAIVCPCRPSTHTPTPYLQDDNCPSGSSAFSGNKNALLRHFNRSTHRRLEAKPCSLLHRLLRAGVSIARHIREVEHIAVIQILVTSSLLNGHMHSMRYQTIHPRNEWLRKVTHRGKKEKLIEC